MTGLINGVDLGNLLAASEESTHIMEKSYGATARYLQAMGVEDAAWSIKGSKFDTAANLQVFRDKIKQVRYSGQPAFLDLTAKYQDMLGFVKLTDFRWAMVAGVLRYEIRAEQIPGIGLTYLQTADACLHDSPLYMSSYEVLNPLAGDSSHAYASNAGPTYEFQHDFYLHNLKNAVQAPILEFHLGDDITKVKVYAYDGSWDLVGDWGGVDAWGDTKSWSDPGATSHDFKLNKGYLGAAVAGIGTISQMPGCYQRALLSVSAMQAASGSEASTTLQSSQLLLRVLAIHSRREAARSYPIITVDDGSLLLDPP